MQSETLMRRLYLVPFLLLAVTLGIHKATAKTDPWIGAYIAKDDSSSSIVRKLTLSKGTAHDYQATIELDRNLGDDNRKKAVLCGYADAYCPFDDKSAADRVFVHFPKYRFSRFLEIYPGEHSASRLESVHYTYFENSRWHSYVSGELTRQVQRPKAR